MDAAAQARAAAQKNKFKLLAEEALRQKQLQSENAAESLAEAARRALEVTRFEKQQREAEEARLAELERIRCAAAAAVPWCRLGTWGTAVLSVKRAKRCFCFKLNVISPPHHPGLLFSGSPPPRIPK